MTPMRTVLAGPALAVSFLAGAATPQALVTGAVFTSTNAADGNQVAVFTRAADGTVTFDELVPTGGFGSGDALGNQGAVVLSEDGRFLLVVNAGSNDVSTFAVVEDGLQLVGTFGSRGVRPVSIALHADLVYVLNAGDDRVAGFRLRDDGSLKFLKGARKKLSGNGVQAAQIGFAPDGRGLFVTEKETDQIVHYAVKKNGKPGKRSVIASAGLQPFGFAFGLRDQLFVSEAADGVDSAGSVSAYEDLGDGALSTITASAGTTETATCWLVLSPDRRLAFTTNTGSDTVSRFAIGFDGALVLEDAAAAATGDAPVDMEMTPDGRFLYVLNSGTGDVTDYALGAGGVLTPLAGDNSGLPPVASGLAAY